MIHVHDVFLLLTAVNCGILANPANGQVSHTSGTTYEQTATYSCNTGYYREGSSTRTCQATGRWSGSAPTCQGVMLLIGLWFQMSSNFGYRYMMCFSFQ